MSAPPTALRSMLTAVRAEHRARQRSIAAAKAALQSRPAAQSAPSAASDASRPGEAGAGGPDALSHRPRTCGDGRWPPFLMDCPADVLQPRARREMTRARRRRRRRCCRNVREPPRRRSRKSASALRGAPSDVRSNTLSIPRPRRRRRDLHRRAGNDVGGIRRRRR